MSQLINDISSFLSSEGFNCRYDIIHGIDGLTVSTPDGYHKTVLILEMSPTNPRDAYLMADLAIRCINDLWLEEEDYPLIITEDRWRTQGQMMRARLLAHLEVFTPIYARNCEVRRIDKTMAKEFLEANHSYGHASCKHCYGLFLKRHTGHIAKEIESCGDSVSSTEYPSPGTLVAVATFSNARKWTKGDQTIRSYEWTRYASLPQLRLCGGMGKVLKAFIKDVQPDDIMSYADLEWSPGDVYMELGFELESQKEPVLFSVDTDSWQRIPIKQELQAEIQESASHRYYMNLGSNKYRLKLTDYK